MARYIGAVCKICRREGGKLYLKGERCFSEKCAVGRRPYPPGQHGQARIKLSEYGLLEKQFAGYYVQATHLKGRTGEEMLGLIERRLDNVVLRMGLASSRAQARQLVRHTHVKVNGKYVNIPSYTVNPNDKIEIEEAAKKIPFIAAALAAAGNRQQASWIEVDKENFSGTFKGMPVRDEMNEPSVREQYVVEYYSR